MSDRFSICHPITAAWEGGWSDHPADPGGKTMYGITEATFRAWLKAEGRAARPVRSITRAEALAIYRRNYWEACGAPKLVPGVDLAVYDASVNSGVSRGRKWLAASVGSSDHSVTVKKICRARLSFMQSLAIWKSFGKGWGRRVADIEVKGVAMALAYMGASKAGLKAVAEQEADAARVSADTADLAGKASGAGAAGTGAAGGVSIDAGTDPAALWILGTLVALLAGAALLLYIRRQAAAARADAYAEAAA